MSVRRRIVSIAERDALLVLLFSAFAGVLLVLTPLLLVGDSWMTLVAGREVIEGGLPRVETMTVLGAGRDWIDQQWGAQVVFYGAEAIGGLRLVILANVLLIAGAYVLVAAASRASGATVRSTLLVSLLAIVAAPWAWQVRAQAVALPLFAATVWLLQDGQRVPRRRTLLVLPLLVVWANAHGSVVMGALLVGAAGVLDLVRRRGTPTRALLLAVGGPLAVLASPYLVDLPGYYHLMIVDPPFAGLIVEWRPTRPEGKTVVFFALAVATLLLGAWKRRRVTLFDAVLLAVTFWIALDAIRSVIWFVLAAATVLPRLMDATLGWRERVVFAGPNRVISAVCVAAVVVAAAVVAAQSSDWYESEWPTEALPAIATATADPAVDVYPMARHADWLLWHLPELRGRMAYDVRFEIYPREEIEELADFASQTRENWGADADEYELLVLDTHKTTAATWRSGLDGRDVVHEQPGILVLGR